MKRIGMSGSHTRFTYNTTPHTATIYSNLCSNYYTGTIQATLPTALSLLPKPTYMYDNYAEELKQRLKATQQVVKSHINEAKIKAKIHADKDTNTK